MLLPLLLLPLLSGLEAQPPALDFDPFSASEESDEMDLPPAESWRGDEALLDFPPRGQRQRRAVAFLEPAHPLLREDLPIQHRGVPFAMGAPEECDCPETLAKGTMVAIVAVLAFLGFFSTSVLLVVAICLLRLVDRQWKSGKEAGGLAKRPLPPLPPPRPERVYLTPKATPGYERLAPVTPTSPRIPNGTYLSASELHPGPRVPPTPAYQKMGAYQAARSPPLYQSPRSKAVPESEYITVNPALGFSSPAPEKTYSGAGNSPAEKKRPGAEEEIYGSPEATKPERSGEASPIAETPASGRENHIYEEVE